MASNIGKVISVSSVKGGVGKTTISLILSGLYYMMKKKVLLIDMDFYGGGIATCLNVSNKKDVFMLIDSISNNRFTSLKDYVSVYNNGIDVLPCPKDLRQASKIESKYIPLIFDLAKKEYDVVIVDTNHVLDEINLTILDNVYNSLFIITNDIVDLKNMKSLVNIFNDLDKKNYITLLNNARDLGKDYLSMYDIRNIIKTNIDYTISRDFYIKNIDKYVLKGEILSLNKTILNSHKKDMENLNKVCERLIKDEVKK